jgi:hypothetical protein
MLAGFVTKLRPGWTAPDFMRDATALNRPLNKE